MNNIVDWLDGWNVGGKTSIIWFILFSAGVVFFSLKIVKNAEVLSTKTKFAGGFIGGVMIAVISAAPEFITSVQQSLIGDPGAAVSDDMGAFLLAGSTIGLSGILFIRETFLNRLKKWTIITLWLSFFFTIGLMFIMYFQADITIGVAGKFAIGLIPLLLLISYFALLFMQKKYGDEDEHVMSTDYITKTTVKQASWRFVFWSILLITASVFTNFAVVSMEHGYSLEPESAGGLFLALTMALPETVAFFALMRKKQYLMAVAVLAGHGFALFVSEFLADAAFVDGPTYATHQVNTIWPLALMSALSFAFLGIHALLGKKFKVFENKIVYSILPSMAFLTYVVGWILLLTIWY